MIVHDAANRVIRLPIGTAECALRVPKLDDRELQVDRHSEQAALRTATAADLAPEVLACDPSSGVLITRWIDLPVWTPERARTESHIEWIAAKVRQLHGLPVPKGVRALDLEALIDGYWSAIAGREDNSQSTSLASHHREALALLRQRPAPAARLCHNDLNAGNLIGEGTAVRLLDWEYAGVGEPLFDLASYTQSNDLSPHQARYALERYGALGEHERFALECRLFDWICVLWLAASGMSSTPAGRERFNALVSRFAGLQIWTSKSS